MHRRTAVVPAIRAAVSWCYDKTSQAYAKFPLLCKTFSGNDADEPCASAVAGSSSVLAAPSKIPSEATEEGCSPRAEAVVMAPLPSHAAAASMPASGLQVTGTSQVVDGKRQPLRSQSCT